MYNWSVDEKEFKGAEDVVRFLGAQPDVICIKEHEEQDDFGNKVIGVRLASTIHPVRKFYIAKYIQEKAEDLKVSVIEQ